MSPLARLDPSTPNHDPAAFAAPGWSGVVMNPIAERTSSSDTQTWAADTQPKPTQPVMAQNAADPSPMHTSATRGPNRSRNQPPGIMKAV